MAENEIKLDIVADAGDAESALNSLINKLQDLNKVLGKTGDNDGVKSLSSSANKITKEYQGIVDATGKSISKTSNITNKGVKDADKRLEELNEKYKNLGADFKYVGTLEGVNREITKYQNALQNALVDKQELELAGKTEGDMYEKAIAKVQRYSNYIEALGIQKEQKSITNPYGNYSEEEFQLLRPDITDLNFDLNSPDMISDAQEFVQEITALFDDVDANIDVAPIDIPSEVNTSIQEVKQNIEAVAATASNLSTTLKDIEPIDIDVTDASTETENLVDETEKLKFSLKDISVANIGNGLLNFSGKMIDAFKIGEDGTSKFGNAIKNISFSSVTNGLLNFSGKIMETFRLSDDSVEDFESELTDLDSKISSTSNNMANMGGVQTETAGNTTERSNLDDIMEKLTQLGVMKKNYNVEPLKTTADFSNVFELQKYLESLDAQAVRTYNKLAKLNEQGSNPDTQRYQGFIYDLQQIQATVDNLQPKFEALRNAGQLDINIPNLDTMQAKVSKLNSALANMKIVVKTDELKQTEKELDKVQKRYEQIRQSIQLNMQANKNYGAGQTYKKQQVELEALRQQYSDLILKQEELSRAGGGGYSLNFSSLISGANKFSTALKNAKLPKGLTSGLSKVKSLLTKLVPSTNSLSKGFKNLSKSSSNLLKPLTKVTKMLKLMVVRMALRQVIAGTQEGFQNLAQYSNVVNADLSLLMNSLNQLKNTFAATAAPILNVVTPALNYLIQVVISAMNYINQFISTLLGKSTWTKATALTEDYASSLSDTASAAGSAADAIADMLGLQGFDELNNLTTNDDSSSSGGSGSGSGTSASDMFTEEEIDNSIATLAESIKEMWENQDFEGIGTVISDKLTEMLNSIDWEKIYSVASNFGSGLAEFLNGLITPELFSALGNTIAGAINTALNFLDGFGDSFDFANFGNSIATGIVSALNGIQWETALSASQSWGRGIADALNSFLTEDLFTSVATTITSLITTAVQGALYLGTELKFDEIGSNLVSGLNTFFDTFPWTEIQATASTWASGVGEFFQSAVSDKDLWKNIGSWIASGINTVVKAGIDFSTSIDWEQLGEDIATSINQFFLDLNENDVAKFISSGINAIGDLIGGLISEIDLGEILLSLSKILIDIDASAKLTLAAGFGVLLASKVVKALGTLALSAVKMKISSFVTESISSGTLANLTSSILSKLGSALKIAATATVIIAEIYTSIKDSAKIANTGTTSASDVAKGIGEGLLGGVATFAMTGNLQLSLAIAVGKIGWTIGGVIYSTFSDYIDSLVELLMNGFTGAEIDLNGDGIANSIGEVWEELWEDIKKAVKELINDIAEAFGFDAPFEERKTLPSTDSSQTLTGVDTAFGTANNLESKLNLEADTYVNDTYTKTVNKAKTLTKSYTNALSKQWKLGETTTDLDAQTNLNGSKITTISKLKSGVKSLTGVFSSNWKGSSATLDATTSLNGTTITTTSKMSSALKSFNSTISRLWGTTTTASLNAETKFNGSSKTSTSSLSASAASAASALTSKWKGSSTELQSYTYVNGAIANSSSSILSKVSSLASSLTSNWKGSSATLSASTKVNGTTTSSTSSTSAEVAKYQNAISGNWTGASSTLKATTKLNNSEYGNSSSIGSAVKGFSSSITGNWSGKTSTLNVQTEVNGSNYSTSSGLANKIKSLRSSIVGQWTGKTMTLGIKASVSDLKSWVNTNVIDSLNSNLKLAGFNSTVARLKAGGGYVDRGQLFIANEAGPEMVGKIGSENAVANNRQITDGIATAVANANQEGNTLTRQEIALLQRQNELLLGILEKETGISSSDIFSSVRKSASDYYKRTGNTAFPI